MSPTIWVHVVFACIGFLIPFFIFWRKKGDRLHKFFGRIFVFSMYVSAFSSFFIQGNGHFSPIHILSVLNIYWLTQALRAIKQKAPDWKREHASNMGAAYISALIAGAGVITRHFIAPGNSNMGYVVSFCVAVPSIVFLSKIVKKIQ